MADVAIKSLSTLAPAAQFLVALAFVALSFFGAIFAMYRGERKKGAASSDGFTIPNFLMSGPLADAMDATHEMNDQSKRQTEEAQKTNAILADISKGIDAFNRGQEHTHRLLEAIMNNQEIRDGHVRTRRDL